jgi:rRNA-processing protein FCF1
MKQTTYILDTSAVVREPELLFPSAEYKIVIPKAVKAEIENIRNDGVRKRILEIIGLAKDKIEIPDENEYIKLDYAFAGAQANRLSTNDILIANTTIERVKKYPGQDIFLVTDDKELATFCQTFGVRTKSVAEAKKTKSSQTEIQKEKTEKLKSFQNSQAISLIFGAIAVVASNTFIASKIDFESIIELPLIYKILFGIGLLITSLGIYWVRHYYRMFYGLVELLVGLLLGIRIFFYNTNSSLEVIALVLQLLTSIYVMIRGLDNMEKDLSNWSSLNKIWKSIYR